MNAKKSPVDRVLRNGFSKMISPLEYIFISQKLF